MSGPTRHLGYVLKRFPRISETFVAAEIIQLEQQGERVTVFALADPDEAVSHGFLREMNAPVVYLPYRPLHQPTRVVRALGRVLRSDARRWLSAAALSLWPPRLVAFRQLMQATVLRDEMRAAGVQHAHAHFASTAARLANLAWRMGGPTYSVTAHAKDIYHEDVRPRHLREKLASATFVSTVSAANRDYLEAIVEGRARLHVIPNAVDLERLGSPPDRRPEEGVVLSVARLVEKKGLEDLVEACGLLAGQGLAVRLEIAGDGPLRDALQEKAARSGARVHFHGVLPNEVVLELYHRASVFSLPCVVASTGDRDGLPTSVLEAMALGVPVVTTAVNGLGDLVVDGHTGLVVPEHDPVALAAALTRMLTDPALAQRLAAQARVYVMERHSLARNVASLRALFPVAP